MLDDWKTIKRYMALLKPIKEATLSLEGQVGRTGIWLVLPAFEEPLQHFEDIRRQLLRPGIAIATSRSEAPPESVLSSLASEHHFLTAGKLGRQKLDEYYRLLDNSGIYEAAILLHARLKWRWFEKHWSRDQDWIVSARKAVQGQENRSRFDRRRSAANPALYRACGRVMGLAGLARLAGWH